MQGKTYPSALCDKKLVDHFHLDTSFIAYKLSLTAAQTKALESLQRRALCIIYEDGDYMLSLSRAGFDTLEERREQLTERFFRRSVLPETSCLHYLLPSKRDVSVTAPCKNIGTFKMPNC